jgi:hypothetical protein
MGLFRDSQVDKLLDAREARDNGKISDADLLRVVKSSTGNELDAAMTEYGGYDAWGH